MHGTMDDGMDQVPESGFCILVQGGIGSANVKKSPSV